MDNYVDRYMAMVERMATAERPSGPESVDWWLARRTSRCDRRASMSTRTLFDDYRAEVGKEAGQPLGLHGWSAVMTDRGFPAGSVRQPRSEPGVPGPVVRVRVGVRLA